MVSVGGPGHGERAPERRMPYESAAATRKAQRLRSAHSCPAGEDVAPRAPADTRAASCVDLAQWAGAQ